MNRELIKASKNGDIKKVYSLLKQGANIHIGDDHYNSEAPLIWASDKGYSEIVELLIEAGANINAQGGEALSTAVYNGNIEIVQILLEAGSIGIDGALNLSISRQMFKDVEIENNLDIAKLLLEAGADPNAVIYEDPGESLLHNAVNRAEKRPGAVGMVKLLLKAGANPNATEIDGVSVLQYANDKKSIELLLEAGATFDGEFEKWGRHDKWEGVRVWYRYLNTDLTPQEVRDLGIILKDDEARYIPDIFRKSGTREVPDLVREISRYMFSKRKSKKRKPKRKPKRKSKRK